MTSVRAYNALRKIAAFGSEDAAWGGGGLVTGLGLNAALGNNSLASYLGSGVIGLFSGLAAKGGIDYANGRGFYGMGERTPNYGATLGGMMTGGVAGAALPSVRKRMAVAKANARRKKTGELQATHQKNEYIKTVNQRRETAKANSGNTGVQESLRNEAMHLQNLRQIAEQQQRANGRPNPAVAAEIRASRQRMAALQNGAGPAPEMPKLNKLRNPPKARVKYLGGRPKMTWKRALKSGGRIGAGMLVGGLLGNFIDTQRERFV